MTQASRAPRKRSARRTHRKGRTSSTRKAAPTRLYILRDITDDLNWDSMVACIVRARNPKQARGLAQQIGLEEIRPDRRKGYTDSDKPVAFWTDPQKTSCRRLSEEGKVEVVLAETMYG